MSLPLYKLIPSTHQDVLSNWLIFLSVLHGLDGQKLMEKKVSLHYPKQDVVGR